MKALCGTKRHWETPELADGHRLLLLTSKAAHDPARLHVYRCECGHGYCVGHSRFPIEVRKAS